MISLFFLSILQKMAKFTQMLLGREHSLSCLSLFNGSIILFKEEESGHSLQNASSFLGIRNGEPPWPYLPHTLRHKDMEAHATLERIETRWQYSRIYMCNNRYYDNDMIRFAVKHAQHYTILDNNLSGKNRNRMGRTWRTNQPQKERKKKLLGFELCSSLFVHFLMFKRAIAQTALSLYLYLSQSV